MRQLLARDGFAVFHGAHNRAEMLMAAATMMTVLPHPDSGPDGITAITDLGVCRGASRRRRVQPPRTRRAHRPLRRPRTPGTVDDSLRPPGPCRWCEHAHRRPGRVCRTGRRQPGSTSRAHPPPVGPVRRYRWGHLGAGLTAIPATVASPARLHLRLRLDDLVTFAPDLLTHLPTLRLAIARRTITVPLGAGQGYILDNHRWLHAREQFTGTRTLYRVLGDPLSSLGLHPGIPSTHHERGEQHALS